jgi:hypothetical protein
MGRQKLQYHDSCRSPQSWIHSRHGRPGRRRPKTPPPDSAEQNCSPHNLQRTLHVTACSLLKQISLEIVRPSAGQTSAGDGTRSPYQAPGAAGHMRTAARGARSTPPESCQGNSQASKTVGEIRVSEEWWRVRMYHRVPQRVCAYGNLNLKRIVC